MERCPFVRQRRCQTLAILRRSFKFQYRPTLLVTEQIDWRLAGLVKTAAVFCALIAGRLTRFVDPTTLRKLFGWFVLLMASVILAQEVHPAIGAVTAGLTVLAAGMSFACTRYANWPLRRVVGRPKVSAAAA